MRINPLFGGKGKVGEPWEDMERNLAFQRAILAIPEGKVSTYGKIAEAAGYPRYHRAVARMLRGEDSRHLPWHRVVGADGAIKTSGASAKEQRSRLRQEGVSFRGERIDLSVFLHTPGWSARGMAEE